MEYPKGGMRDCIGQHSTLKDALDIGEYWQSLQDVPEESYFHVLELPSMKIWHEDETYSEFHELVQQLEKGDSHQAKIPYF